MSRLDYTKKPTYEPRSLTAGFSTKGYWKSMSKATQAKFNNIDTIPNGRYKGWAYAKLPQSYLDDQCLNGRWPPLIQARLDREWLKRNKKR